MLTIGQRRKKANKKEQVIPIENKPQKKNGRQLLKKIGMINFVKIINDHRVFIATIDVLLMSSHRMEASESLYFHWLNQILDQFLVD
jgi:hypothetical protein